MSPSMASFSYPHKNGEYSFRVPTPPRIVVPPPNLDQDALPHITMNADPSLGVDYGRLVTKNALTEWTYEKRRDAQAILPFLYLGPMGAAKDETLLNGERFANEHGPAPITMLLHIRQKHGLNRLMAASLQRAAARGIDQSTIELANNQELISVFPRTTDLINQHLHRVRAQTGRMGRVLVFCESGNERSAAVVAAYLMRVHADVDHIKAMQLIQAQRFCANFDDALKRLLQGYWDIICAERAVAEQRGGGGGGMRLSQSLAKRGLRDRGDEDEEMEDGMEDDDVERFGGRAFAPFIDQP